MFRKETFFNTVKNLLNKHLLNIARTRINGVFLGSWRIFIGQTGRCFDYLFRGKVLSSGLLRPVLRVSWKSPDIETRMYITLLFVLDYRFSCSSFQNSLWNLTILCVEFKTIYEVLRINWNTLILYMFQPIFQQSQCSKLLSNWRVNKKFLN